MSRVAVMFGQFGIAADPVNLPRFRQRLMDKGIDTILVQHTDSQKVFDFLHGHSGFTAIVGASLGAGSAPICAGYLHPQEIDFVGGFQPSDWDPVMHPVEIKSDMDIITRAVTVPTNVREALCFRNPIAAATGGLGHATYVIPALSPTKLQVIERPDVHPGDFGQAQDIMVEKILELIEQKR